MHGKNLTILAGMFLALHLLSATVAASEAEAARPLIWKARLVTDGEHAFAGIQNLQWEASEVDVLLETGDGVISPAATLKGRITGAVWTLLHKDQKVPQEGPGADEGKFTLHLPLEDEQTLVHLYAVNESGAVQETKAFLVVQDWPAVIEARSSAMEASRKPWSVVPSLGLSFLSFSQNERAHEESISEQAITAKVAGTYLLVPKKWSLGLSGFVTAASLNTNRTDTRLRFLGINGRAGYEVSSIEAPWKLTIMGGLYYTSMWAANRQFGFRNLVGPQVFPVLRRTLAGGGAVSGYLKYALVGNAGGVFNFGNHELATGITWELTRLGRLLRGRTLALSLDVANLRLADQGADISSTSVSFSAGLGF